MFTCNQTNFLKISGPTLDKKFKRKQLDRSEFRLMIQTPITQLIENTQMVNQMYNCVLSAVSVGTGRPFILQEMFLFRVSYDS